MNLNEVLTDDEGLCWGFDNPTFWEHGWVEPWPGEELSHPYFSEASIFMEAFDIAKKNGLEMEFLAEFLNGMTSEEVNQKAHDALYKWDL